VRYLHVGAWPGRLNHRRKVSVTIGHGKEGTSQASEEAPMNRDAVWNFANHWVAAWNAHDLGSIMMHYEEGIELASPVAAHLLGTDGKVAGKANVRAYFQRGRPKPSS
jgi:hypothetical protein